MVSEILALWGCRSHWKVVTPGRVNLKYSLRGGWGWMLISGTCAYSLPSFPLVQQDQYVFLNQCVLDIIRSHRDSKVDLIYQNTTAMTIYENIAPMATFGQTNGYIA